MVQDLTFIHTHNTKINKGLKAYHVTKEQVKKLKITITTCIPYTPTVHEWIPALSTTISDIPYHFIPGQL